MSNAASHGADGRKDDEVLRELEREITSWLEQGGMNLMARLDQLDTPDPATAKDVIKELVQQDGTSRGGLPADEPVLRDHTGSDFGARWSSLLAAYIDSLNRSALQDSEEGRNYAVSYGLDEGHAGGCG